MRGRLPHTGSDPWGSDPGLTPALEVDETRLDWSDIPKYA